MRLKRHTRYTWTDSATGETFEIPWEFSDGSELFWMSDDGCKAVLGALTYDDSPSDPFEEFDEGEFYQFDTGRSHGEKRPDIEDWKRIIRFNPGRVVSVDACGDGYRAGQLMTIKDTKGDARTSPAELVLDDMDGYYIAPADATDPYRYAKGRLETYSAWCEGDAYGVCVWVYTREPAAYLLGGTPDPDEGFTDWSEPDRDCECWGFYGYDYAAEELKSEFKALCTEPVPPAGNILEQKELTL